MLPDDIANRDFRAFSDFRVLETFHDHQEKERDQGGTYHKTVECAKE